MFQRGRGGDYKTRVDLRSVVEEGDVPRGGGGERGGNYKRRVDLRSLEKGKGKRLEEEEGGRLT